MSAYGSQTDLLSSHFDNKEKIEKVVAEQDNIKTGLSALSVVAGIATLIAYAITYSSMTLLMQVLFPIIGSLLVVGGGFSLSLDNDSAAKVLKLEKKKFNNKIDIMNRNEDQSKKLNTKNLDNGYNIAKSDESLHSEISTQIIEQAYKNVSKIIDNDAVLKDVRTVKKDDFVNKVINARSKTDILIIIEEHASANVIHHDFHNIKSMLQDKETNVNEVKQHIYDIVNGVSRQDSIKTPQPENILTEEKKATEVQQ